MGAGTLTIPLIVSLNGIILGPLLIIFAAILSYHSGMLLVNNANTLHIIDSMHRTNWQKWV